MLSGCPQSCMDRHAFSKASLMAAVVSSSNASVFIRLPVHALKAADLLRPPTLSLSRGRVLDPRLMTQSRQFSRRHCLVFTQTVRGGAKTTSLRRSTLFAPHTHDARPEPEQ